MRQLLGLLADLFLVAVSTVLALLLRDNLEFSSEKFRDLLPYLGISVLAALAVLPSVGATRTVWRWSSGPDYYAIAASAPLIVLSAIAVGFWFNRLDGVARSLPVIQALLIVFLMSGVRLVQTFRHSVQHDIQTARANLVTDSSLTDGPAMVLIVGLNKVAELYLRSVDEFGGGRVRIAGLLGQKPQQTGRIVHRRTVLGTAEQISLVLRQLEVHGVYVDKVVVALPPEGLTVETREALAVVEKSTSITLEFLTESLGFGRSIAGETAHPNEASAAAPVFQLDARRIDAILQRPYWRMKRAFDVVVSLLALIVLSPLIAALALIVAIDVGLPVAFWQQRPGWYGHPFRLYKLRTMAPAHDREGHRIADANRLSIVGKLLRGWRFDELPQLVNVLIGDMSLVGPRPLLPSDQPGQLAARLLIRPGLTGWAQIQGGRDVSVVDKAALDIWYVCNASLWLDLKILVRTVPTVLYGEQRNAPAIRRAWRDLRAQGVCTAMPDVDGTAGLSADATGGDDLKHAA